MQRELRVPLGDLRYLSLQCNQCHTEMTFDLSQELVTAPVECSCCGKDWEGEGAYVAKLNTLLSTLRSATNVEFSFRVATD